MGAYWLRVGGRATVGDVAFAAVQNKTRIAAIAEPDLFIRVRIPW
jgi:hypothetical protein